MRSFRLLFTLCAAAFAAVSLPPSRADGALKGRICYARRAADRYLLHVIDPDGKVAEVFASVKPGGHSEEVLSALAALRSSP